MEQNVRCIFDHPSIILSPQQDQTDSLLDISIQSLDLAIRNINYLVKFMDAESIVALNNIILPMIETYGINASHRINKPGPCKKRKNKR